MVPAKRVALAAKEDPMSGTHLPIKELLEANLDHDCAGVGEDHICIKIAAIVVQVPSFQYADPSFLEQVFRQIGAASQAAQIAQQAMFVAVNQFLQ